ncbi:MAG: DUF86 domain-containing protein [Micrococcales bacterium]|nr:DUF86 domain-containing protein [Micrococcales bacterium]
MKSRELLLLAEMIDAADQAQALVAGWDVEAIGGDRQRHDALLWNFTVLGEAAAQLPQAFRAAHPDVDWARPVALRNRIVHGYWGVDLGILRATAIKDLPGFASQLRYVLDQLRPVAEPSTAAEEEPDRR